jgi:aquaporin Z
MTISAEQSRASGAIRAHWRIYAIDGALLGIFMISACVSCAIVEHPSSPVRQAIVSEFLRRMLIGIAMGLTAICLIYSHWGKRSGAFMNPAMVISFFRLGQLNATDAAGYIVGQFVGGAAGVILSSVILGMWVRDPSVNYVVTIPGSYGPLAAWIGEFFIAALMIGVVMAVNKVPKLAPYTGCFAAALVALYITFEAPLSGMSLNPARTFGSAIVANVWTGWWIYLTAPVLGMFFGIEVHRRLTSEHQRLCGKLSHSRSVACFIRCQCIEGKS